MLRIFLIISCVFSVITELPAQKADVNRLSDLVSYMSSPELKGRRAGSKEEVKMAQFIKKQFIEKNLDSFNMGYTSPFLIDDQHYSQNIFAYLKGSKKPNEYIVIGAHYDHLGYGTRNGNDSDSVYFPGADDNASGTAILLELARLLSTRSGKLKRSILFVAFGAEELGLIGSSNWINYPPMPLNQVKIMLNLDMLGMLAYKNNFEIQGENSFKRGHKILNKSRKYAPFKLNTIQPIVWSSDHAPFYDKKIPIFFFSTGLHPYYHQETDTPDRLDYKGMEQITNYLYQLIILLDKENAFVFKSE